MPQSQSGAGPVHDDSQQNGTGAHPPGNSAAQQYDATEQDAYWRDAYVTRPYADETVGYDQYRPAYRYGWESRVRLDGRRWDEVERELERGWRESRGGSRLGWSDARLAAKDAWHRVDHLIADARQLAT